MQVSILVSMPMPTASEKPQGTSSDLSLEDRVEYAADCFNANYDPEDSFAFLRRVHQYIVSSGKDSEKAQKILRITTPIIALHAPHLLEGVSLSKTLQKEP